MVSFVARVLQILRMFLMHLHPFLWPYHLHTESEYPPALGIICWSHGGGCSIGAGGGGCECYKYGE